MADMRIPVTLLTGFLGSGKTTVLNRLLKAPDLADTAVIVNEFGAVGIDHLLVEQALENTVLLKNGCICCTVRGDVADTLAALRERADAGATPTFRRVVIETTGLADPGPVLQALASGAVAEAYRLDGVVTTVDALHGCAQLARQDEARAQAAFADRILLTKTDLAGADRTAATQAAVRRWNRSAPILRVLHGDVAADAVFGLSPRDGAAQVQRWLGAPHDHDHDHDHDMRHHHHGDIAATLVSADTPLRWDDVRRWLDSLLSTRGAELLRLKGVVALEGAQSRLLLQAVHHMLHPPAWLDTPNDIRRTEIVLITRGLSSRGLRRSFAVATGAVQAEVGS